MENYDSIQVDGESFQVIDEFHFKTPSLIYLTGASYTGKTEFIFKLIENQQKLFQPNVKRIVFVYAVHQPELFKRIKRVYPEIEFVNGLFELQSKFEFSRSNPTLLILDDVAHESSTSEYVLNLAVRDSHHKAITTVYVQHNLYQQNKFSKTIKLQTKYLVLFKNPMDMNQYKILGKQLFGEGFGQIVVNVFREISNGWAYPHLVLDKHPDSDPNICLISNIFPEDSVEKRNYTILHQFSNGF